MDEPIVWYEGAGATDQRWLHADERGSIVAVTDANANRIAINRYDELEVRTRSPVRRRWWNKAGEGGR